MKHLFHGDVDDVERGSAAADKLMSVDGFAEIFPEDKYHIVRKFQSMGHIVGMTGDGANVRVNSLPCSPATGRCCSEGG